MKNGRFSLYTVLFRAIFRRKLASLLLILLMALGAFSAVILHHITIRQQAAMDKMVETTRIRCVVTDANGMNTERLNMLSFMVDKLMGYRHEQDCYVDAYIRNLRAKATSPLTQPEDYSLCRILSLDSDSRLSLAEGARVTLFDGWTEDIFRTSERVCLVPDTLELEGNTIILEEENQPSVEMTVVGTVSNGPENVIYCPFYMRWDETMSYAYLVESCSFDIKDNARLEECKAGIYETFVEPSMAHVSDGLTFGVLVQDEVYLKTLEEFQSNLRMLRLLLPLLLVLMGCIGFFASYLSTRGRLKEFAVMRCLGLKQRRIFALVFGEFLLLSLVGGTVGLLVGFSLDGRLEVEALWKAALLTIVFLLGAAIATVHMTRVNVMKLMKVED